MEYINGYFFDTELEAQNAVSLCNQYYHIPHDINSITQNWVSYQPINDGFYIMYNDSLYAVLGQPQIIPIYE
jgi:hypothetical protein